MQNLSFPALPEIFMGVMALVLLVIGVSLKNSTRFITILALLVLAITGYLLTQQWGDAHSDFGGLFITDNFAIAVKLLMVIAAFLTLTMFLGSEQLWAGFEFPILILLSSVGIMAMISANDLMSFYVGLELQSLSLYVLAAMNRDSVISSEAGLKYFVLGALSSGLFLYGASLVYGFTGTTNFTSLAEVYNAVGIPNIPIAILLGFIFIIIALSFKVAAAPFHMWTPDVYQGAPTIVTGFFASAPKIGAVALFARVVCQPFFGLSSASTQVLMFLSIASMTVGAVAALRQNNIKRLMAYSAIGHVGYILIGIETADVAGISAVLIYLALYVAMNIGVFACILLMRRNNEYVENISDLAGLGQQRPLIAAALTMFMLSMAGIPPLAGFFGKFYIFLAAIDKHQYILAAIGVITSVIGAFYYLRIIKIMYFDVTTAPLDRETSPELGFIIALTAAITFFYFVYPSPLIQLAKAAAQTLF